MQPAVETGSRITWFELSVISLFAWLLEIPDDLQFTKVTFATALSSIASCDVLEDRTSLIFFLDEHNVETWEEISSVVEL